MMHTRAHVLVVDDIEANRTLLADMMFSLGHDPEMAENGQQALERMHRRLPDLVLLDIVMRRANSSVSDSILKPRSSCAGVIQHALRKSPATTSPTP